MYSVILYSLFLLFWVAIIYDFAKRPKDRDDDKFMDLPSLRQLARTFWVGWITIVLLYTLISVLAKKVIHETDNPPSADKSDVCVTQTECNFPCYYDESICKLKIPKLSYDGRALLKKFIWKFIDLYLIYKGDLDLLTYYKAEPYELEKTTKQGEYFFTYIDYQKVDEYGQRLLFHYLYYKQSEFMNDYYILS